MSTKTVEGVWYPSDLSPHMFYINGELSGMAVAIPCLRGESQKWEAFDMRRLNGPNISPVLLGSYEGIYCDRANREGPRGEWNSTLLSSTLVLNRSIS